jgi:hypothetical protein
VREQTEEAGFIHQGWTMKKSRKGPVRGLHLYLTTSDLYLCFASLGTCDEKGDSCLMEIITVPRLGENPKTHIWKKWDSSQQGPFSGGLQRSKGCPVGENDPLQALRVGFTGFATRFAR